jgi:hypothetical protein
MAAHVRVTAELLQELLTQGDEDLKAQAATGCIVEKLLRLYGPGIGRIGWRCSSAATANFCDTSARG